MFFFWLVFSFLGLIVRVGAVCFVWRLVLMLVRESIRICSV